MLGVFYALWGIPVAIFVVSPSYTPQPWPMWFAIGLTLVFCLIDRQFFAFAIPFAGMLSPLAKSGRILGLLPSEMFLAFCALWVFVSALGRGRVKLLPGDAYLVGLVCFAILSFLLSFEYAALISSVWNWMALVTAFAMTRITLRTMASASLYLLSLSVAAAYVAILIITGFIHGMPLAEFFGDSEIFSIDQERLNSLFRASYFYTNVLYLLGIAAVLALVAFIIATKPVYKIISAGLVLLMLFTLFVMYARTGLVAFAISVFMLTLVALLARMNVRRHLWLNQIAMVVFISIFAWITLTQVWESSSIKIDTSSLAARVDTTLSSFDVLMDHPERLAFGFGPDASTRASSEAVMAARQSSEGIEGAVDSAYVTYFFEYGFFFLVLFMLFGAHSMLRLFQIIKQTARPDPITMALFVSLVFIFIAAISQVIGTSKVAWVVVQIFALVGACLSQHRPSTSPHRFGNKEMYASVPTRS